MSFPKVAIIILNWNGWKDTIKCLESVYQITYPIYDVIVVDNGSKDNSVQKIKEYCKGEIIVESKFFKYNPNNKPIHILEYTKEEAERGGNPIKEKYFSKLPSNRKLKLIINDKNYGFAGGNNIGIRYALKDKQVKYIFLLNNDAYVEKNCIELLVKTMEKHKNIGLAQPKVLKDWNVRIIDTTGHTWRFGVKNSWKFGLGYIVDRGEFEIDNGQYDNKTDIISCCGCACMYRREMLEQIGLFRDDFFAYCEDVELSWRAWKYGWRAIYVPDAVAYHKRGKTRKKDNKLNRKCAILRRRNWAITLKEHGNLLQKIFLIIIWGMCGLISMLNVKEFELDSRLYFYLIKILLTNKNFKILDHKKFI